MKLKLSRHDENQMYRDTPVSRTVDNRETGVSRYIFKGVRDVQLFMPLKTSPP